LGSGVSELSCFEARLATVPASLQEPVRRYWSGFSEAALALETVALENIALEKSPEPFTEALLDELCRVWAVSDFVAQRCVRQPGLLFDLIESGDLHRAYTADKLSDLMQQALQSVTDFDGLGVQLRQLRQREMVRIAWRDIAGLADLNETMADVSALADACIQGALTWLYTAQVAEQGEPCNEQGEPQQMVVLGMGKLGACELNFSSDVDLIFAFPEAGETTQGSSRRHISNEAFFARLGKQLIRALDETTAEGFVFRVDMRLRPFGQSGVLASSFEALENYYQAHGRDWERYALIKARVVAGDYEAGERLFDILRPFVFRRYLDFGAFESLRDMKQMIGSELKRKGMANHVKLGAGGIREVEFIGQAFQLVRGGREPALQSREIQTVLAWLADHDYLPTYVTQHLLAAYEFLRNTEHRLQEFQDQQTHQLPEDELGQQRLAFAMGFDHWDEFLPVLRGHMARVHSHFEQVFAAPQTNHAEVDTSGLSDIWLADMEATEAVAVLSNAGYLEAESTWSSLQALKTGRHYQSLSRTGRTRMDRLMPLLLGAVIEIDAESPDVVLQRLLTMLEAIAQRTAYLALLGENPMALSQLVRLCAASPWIAQYLARHPLLLDELLDPRSLYVPPERKQLEADLQQRLSCLPADDLEQAMDALRHFKQASVLRVAAVDVMEAAPLMEVSNYLTDIAEVVLQAALELAWSHLVARHGWPSSAGGGENRHENKGFAVIAYGKLGGLELGYGSDLDLVFVHSADDQKAMTDGSKAIADTVFYARLGQRIIHILTAHTPAGTLYETDMRLRPSGASGLLVVSLSSLRDYQFNKAWTWEHQALVRARVVTGDARIREGFEVLRREVLMLPRDPGNLKKDIVEMRERMRESLINLQASEQEGKFDLKQGLGGIADIEFMVQYGALSWAHNTPALIEYTDNIRLLEGFATLGFMSSADTGLLCDAYRSYRAEVHRLALQEQKAVVDKNKFTTERAAVKRLWLQLFNQ